MNTVLYKTLAVAGTIAWMRMGWQYRLLLLVCLVFPSRGHEKDLTPPDPPHKLTADSSEQVVRPAVRIVMPLADARKILEKKGFTCRLSTYKDGTQSLHCRIWERLGFLVSYERKVTLDIKDGKVSKVWFAEGGLGP